MSLRRLLFLGLLLWGVFAHGADAEEKPAEDAAPQKHEVIFEPSVTTYIDPETDQVQGHVVVAYAVEFTDKEAAKTADIWWYRLQDKVWKSLTNYLHYFWRARGDINQAHLKYVIKSIVRQVIPEEKIKAVKIMGVRLAPVV